MSRLPALLINLLSLRDLDISHNYFTKLPSCIGDLSTLTSLTLGFNDMKELCNGIIKIFL